MPVPMSKLVSAATIHFLDAPAAVWYASIATFHCFTSWYDFTTWMGIFSGRLRSCMGKALVFGPLFLDTGLHYTKIEVPVHSRHDAGDDVVEIVRDVGVVQCLPSRRPRERPGQGREEGRVPVGLGCLYERFLGRQALFELLELGTLGQRLAYVRLGLFQSSGLEASVLSAGSKSFSGGSPIGI